MPQTAKDVKPLYNDDAERTIIASALLREDALQAVLAGLKHTDFGNRQYATVFQKIKAIAESGATPDVATLREHRVQEDLIADVLIAPASVNYRYLIEKIIELSQARQVAAVLECAQESIYGPNSYCQIEDIVDRLQSIGRQHTTATPRGLISLSELAKMDFKEPSWLVPGILPDSGVHMLKAAPKIGKSWLCLDLALSLASGGEVLGHHVEDGTSFYLALEDSPGRIFNRVKKITGGALFPEKCLIQTQWKEGAVGLQTLENEIGAHGRPKLIIIDTLGRFFPAKDGNDYTDTTMIMARLKEFAENNKTPVLLVHHDRKNTSGDDHFMNGIGSAGYAAGVDTMITIEKRRGQNDGILKAGGRDIEEVELGIHFNPDNCRWMVTGPAAEVADSVARAEIIDVLRTAGESMSPKEICEALDRPSGRVRVQLHRMIQDGQIAKTERGRYKALNIENSNHCNISNNRNNCNIRNICNNGNETVEWQSETLQCYKDLG